MGTDGRQNINHARQFHCLDLFRSTMDSFITRSQARRLGAPHSSAVSTAVSKSGSQDTSNDNLLDTQDYSLDTYNGRGEAAEEGQLRASPATLGSALRLSRSSSD